MRQRNRRHPGYLDASHVFTKLDGLYVFLSRLLVPNVYNYHMVNFLANKICNLGENTNRVPLPHGPTSFSRSVFLPQHLPPVLSRTHRVLATLFASILMERSPRNYIARSLEGDQICSIAVVMRHYIVARVPFVV